MIDRANAKVVDAMVPLAEMFGYATSLRSMSQGRANYTMEFDHYSEAPASVVEEIVKKNAQVPDRLKRGRQACPSKNLKEQNPM